MPIASSPPSLLTSIFLTATIAWHRYDADGWASWLQSSRCDHTVDGQRNAFSLVDSGNPTMTLPQENGNILEVVALPKKRGCQL
jgi:hypothetical protein